MKGGGWFSRLTGRSGAADPFAAMGTPPGTTIQASPVGVPVGPAPAPDGATGPFVPPGPQAAQTPPAAGPAEPRTERPPAPGRDAGRVADAWGNVCDHFAIQVMLLAEQLRPALDQLEEDEHDPERLDRLYTVDHAITRIRRAARDLRVLSDRGDDETTGPTTSLVDTIRVALSSIERYTQVSIGSIAELAVVGYVSDDVASLLAALLDNATRYSPSTVTVSGHLVSDGGVMFRIEDSGIGLTAPHVAALNRVLDSDVPPIDDHTARHTGFAIVHRLARKHGIRVQLASRAAPAGASGGTTAMVTIPASLLTEIPDAPLSMAPVVREPEDADTDPRATAHLTVARTPARRGPVAAVPDDEPASEDAPAAPAEDGAEHDQPVPYEPGPDAVTPNGFAEPAVVRDETPPPLPRREPASLRGPDGPPPRLEEPPEPPAEEAAEQRRAFAEDVAAFSAAFGAEAPPVDDAPFTEQQFLEESHEGDAPPDDTPPAAAFDAPAFDAPVSQPPMEEAHVDDVPSADATADPDGAPSPGHPHDSEEQVP